MKLFFYLILAFGLGILWYERDHPHSDIRDSDEYVDLALNLEHSGNHYAGPYYSFHEERDLRLYSKRTPAYPVFLGINSNRSLSIFRFLQVGFLLLIFIIGLSFLREVGCSDRRSLAIYSLLFLVNIPLFFTLTFRLSDLLLASIISVFSLSFYRYLKERNSKLLLQCSILLSIAVLTKPVVWPFIIIWTLYLLFLRSRQKLGIMNALPILVVILFSWLNYSTTGVLHFSSISAINKAQYNSKLMIAQSKGIDSSDSFMSSDKFIVPRNTEEFKEYRSYMDDLFVNEVKKNPLAYLKVHVTGMIKMLLDPGRYEIYTFLGTETSKTELTPLLYAGKWSELFKELKKNGFAFYLLLTLSAISLFKILFAVYGVFKTNKQFLIVSLVICLYFLGITGPVGAYRFAIPIQIFIILFATIGLSSTLRFLEKRPK